MSEEITKATYTGELRIGEIVIPCAVLEDGRRVVSQEGFSQALGVSVDKISDLLVSANLKSFISQEAIKASKPVLFQSLEDVEVSGYLAELLSKVCRVYLDARDANALMIEQEAVAVKCNNLLRGLAIVGTTALIDEATGYQRDKDRQALHRILEDYFSKELALWAKRLPEDFYKHLFKLRRWQYSPLSLKRPKYVGKLIDELIFRQLPVEVLEELKQKNPKEGETEDIGNPQLERQIIRVVTLMQVSPNWRIFETLFARAHPRGTVHEEQPPSQYQQPL